MGMTVPPVILPIKDCLYRGENSKPEPEHALQPFACWRVAGALSAKAYGGQVSREPHLMAVTLRV